MKRIVSLLLTFLLAFSFSACSVETVDQYNSRISAEHSSSTESSSKRSDSSDSDEESKDESDSQSPQQARTDTSGSSSNGASKSGGAGSSKPSGSSGSSKSPGTSSSGTSSKSSSSSSQQAAESITITISVTCSQIVGHADLDSSIKDLVPANGILMSSTSVSLKKDATVYDALQSACSSKGGTIGYQSGYVYSLFGINEKKCGGSSGWKYKVNGTTPNVGCNSYKLSNGDTVEWYYTTSIYG